MNHNPGLAPYIGDLQLSKAREQNVWMHLIKDRSITMISLLHSKLTPSKGTLQEHRH